MLRLLYPFFSIAFFAVAAAPTCAVHEWTLLLDPVRVIQQKVDPAGNLYVLLYSAQGGAELKRFDTSGRLLWTSPPFQANARSFQGNARFDVDAAGDAYLTICPAEGYGREPEDVVTVKYDPSGRVLWRARFAPDAGWRNGYGTLAVDRGTGAAYVVTSMRTDSEGEGALATIKYAADGRQEWVRRYRPGAVFVGMPSDDALGVAADGGAVVVARVNLPDADVLLRYDAQGAQLWAHRDNIGTMAHLVVGADGAIYIGTSAGVFTKYAPTGEILWTAPGPAWDPQVDGAGNFYSTRGFAGEPQVITNRYGPSGELLWSAQYVAADADEVMPGALTVDASGSVYLTVDLMEEVVAPDSPLGWMYRTAAVATVKYDADGTQQWVAIHDPPPASGAISIRDVAVDVQGRVYVLMAGVVIKYAQVEYAQPGGP